MQPIEFSPSPKRRFLAFSLYFSPFMIYAILRGKETILIGYITIFIFFVIIVIYREIEKKELICFENGNICGPGDSTEYPICIPLNEIDLKRSQNEMADGWNRIWSPTIVYGNDGQKIKISHTDFNHAQRSQIFDLINKLQISNIPMNNISSQHLTPYQKLFALFQQKLSPSDYPQIQALLDEIDDLNRMAGTAVVVPYIFHHDAWVKTAVSHKIHQLISHAAASDLAWLDSHVRTYSMWYRHQREHWLQIKPSDLNQLAQFGEEAVSLAGVLSMHNNGFVRETAVSHLTSFHTGAELPFLLLRTNDWIEPVRDLAVTAVQERITPENAHYFVQQIYILSQMQTRSRARQSQLPESIIQFLQSPAGQPALFAGFHLASTQDRRTSFTIALQGDTVDNEKVIPIGLQDPDPIIRNRMIRQIKTLPVNEIEKYLPAMQSDPFMAVRREALRIVLQHFPEQAETELQKALVDGSAGLRFEAQFHLRKREPSIDFVQFYRQLILDEHQNQLHIGIAGLSEVGKKEDAELIRPFLTHSRIKVRKTAVKAISKLNPDQIKHDLLNALQDESPGVSREAKKAILYTRSQFSIPSDLWQIVQSSSHPHARKNAIILLTTLSKWQSIYYLLSALKFQNEIELSIIDFIKRWLLKFNQSFTRPTSGEKEQISVIYSNIEHQLPDHLRNHLDSILQSIK